MPDLIALCRKHNLLMVSAADPARHRFELDDHGAFATIEGIFPCARDILFRRKND